MDRPGYALGFLYELCSGMDTPRDDREMLLRHLVRNAKVSVSRDGDRITLVFDASDDPR